MKNIQGVPFNLSKLLRLFGGSGNTALLKIFSKDRACPLI
jgi:hypothetical protein